ncbi:2,3-dihydroxybiphenyl 1,2-dioxygenase [Thermomonospora echinospora]|uniref:2,3-dihydroxybiphenyl 1,2-dioxygenase n=1 Tax=Thermomonospora echinospora TaxID=1992 RepID=A0A1H6BZF6_9ACTN|nr:VOC family protein [Thermomonospora echinospora]SEG66068.1 2,3-dihydroxybiphenyl 1,2-dioxygenase [Thermomonospora echinospora]
MIQSLSYIGFSSPGYAEWLTFGPEVLGMQIAGRGDDGTVRLRVDDADHRLVIHPGAEHALAYLGWGVRTPAELAALTARIEEYGLTVHEGGPELAAERRVAGLSWFEDPWGNRHEISWGQFRHPGSFRPGRPMGGGFVTGEQGLGHAVLVVPDMGEANDFFTRILGFRLSDRIIDPPLNAQFYHVNGRHHSLAIAEVPGAAGFQHLMVEVASLDDVGIAYDLCEERDVPIVLTIGRHVNDLMTSFYLYTPAGFHLEYGHGGVVVDDALWEPATYTSTKIWGHRGTRYRDELPFALFNEPKERG